MMSGFEIVGVILGGLPLVIKAAELYKKGLEPLVKWHRYKLGFRAFVHDVDIEKQMFEALVDRLLQYTDLSMEQKEMLRRGEDVNGWCHAETERALRKRLGDSFDACKYLLEELESDLFKLQTMLSLKDGSVDWARPGEDKWHYQRKRIGHSFSKSGPETIASLSKNIKRFRDLLDVLDERVGTGKQDQKRTMSKDATWAKIFECIRRQALSLHAALKNGWKCTCDVPHLTSLRLQRRATGEWSSQFILAFIPPPDSLRAWGSKKIFSVAVKEFKKVDLPGAVCSTPSPLPEGYLNKLKSNIELSVPARDQLAFYKESNFGLKSSTKSISGYSSLKKGLESSSNVTIQGNRDQTLNFASIPFGRVKKNRIKKVGWNMPSTEELQVPIVPPSQSAPNLLPPNASEPSKDLPPVQIEVISEITDLCSAISTSDSNTICLGYLPCPENHHHEFHPLKKLQGISVPTTQDVISLEELLSRPQPLLKLTRKQQYRLTVVLASSLLQLQTTPWMMGKLEKKDIFFEFSGAQVFAEQPYILHSFPYTPPQTLNTPSALRFATRASLVQLGILLLELCFGSPIEAQTHIRSQYLVNGVPHNDTDFLTARDWVSDVEQEAGTGFQEAIKCCLNFDGKPDWGDRKFMQGFYDGVVKPLEGVLGDWGWDDEPQ